MTTILIKIFLFLIISIGLSLIPVNNSFTPETGDFAIFISSNGVHTDLVLPVETGIIDWKDIFKEQSFQHLWPYAPYIAFGWGERGFYLNTPEWKDLRPGTALKAMLIPSSSAMHVTLWSLPEEDQFTAKLLLTENEYRIIVEYILKSFKRDANGKVIKIDHPGYGEADLFYESTLKFHLFRTCNVWTNTGLKRAGIRTSLWSLYDRPILYHLS